MIKNCKHENTTTKNVIKEEVWGSMTPVEWTEVCLDCGDEILHAYGTREKWENEN